MNVLLITTLYLTTAYGQYLNRKPYPTYSLENMPKTRFSCRDKILGGYYADSETQCQMFHVCVKVAGVGVQDFRFLCPNGTAFDQEAQICADWGDVDCEQATLYYSSDNFDLYRIGSGFESKRAPLAEEDEATFHLQRAETNDVRRSKQTIINQSVRPEQPSQVYNRENTETTPNFQRQTQQPPKRQPQPQQSLNNDQFYQPPPQPQYNNQPTKKSKEPIITIQKPLTTKKPYYNNNQKPFDQQYTNQGNQGRNYNGNNNNQNDYQTDTRNDDELLKGSHSSNFFNNRNNGKDDDLVEFTKSPTPPNIKRPTNQRGRQRIRNPSSRQNYGQINNNNVIPSSPTKTTIITTPTETPTSTKSIQKSTQQQKNGNSKTFTLQNSFRAGSSYDTQFNYNNNRNNNVTTINPSVISTTTQRNYVNFIPTKSNQQTQQNIQPTTYNPSHHRTKSVLNYDDYRTPKPNSYSSTSSTQSQNNNNNNNPFYNVQYEKAAEGTSNNNNDDSIFNKFPQVTTPNYNNFGPTKQNSVIENKHKQQQQQRRNDDQFFRQTSQNYQVPLTVRPLEARKVNAGLVQNQTNFISQNNTGFQQQQFYDSSPPVNNHYRGAFPTPFTKSTTTTTTTTTTTPVPNVNTNIFPPYSNPTPRGFSFDGPRNALPPPSQHQYQQQQQQQPQPQQFNSNNNVINRQQKISRPNNENYNTPSTTPKKFSTLVPKDQYYPTTFKPATYKKQFVNGYNSPAKNFNFAASSYLPTTSSTSTTTTVVPTSEPDEDDGQYHPELYEKDFPRHKFQNKSKPKSRQPSIRRYQTTLQPSSSSSSSSGPSSSYDFGDEDEFLKPSHSLNIAYGANQFRNEKLEKFNKQQQSSPNTSYSKASTPIRTTQIHQTTTTTKSPPSHVSHSSNYKKSKRPHQQKDEDTSYDYAYYDTGSDNPTDYTEYDVISEFGKTKNKNKKA